MAFNRLIALNIFHGFWDKKNHAQQMYSLIYQLVQPGSKRLPATILQKLPGGKVKLKKNGGKRSITKHYSMSKNNSMKVAVMACIALPDRRDTSVLRYYSMIQHGWKNPWF